ncbi:MAG: hypothetical protein WKG07_08735 [Hymenobacter sp.]
MLRLVAADGVAALVVAPGGAPVLTLWPASRTGVRRAGGGTPVGKPAEDWLSPAGVGSAEGWPDQEDCAGGVNRPGGADSP